MNDQFTEIRVLVRDDDNQLVQMLEYIRHISSIGHSFDIVVDPDNSKYCKKFYADGDGSFFIKEVKKNGIKVKTNKEGNIIEIYLKNIK